MLGRVALKLAEKFPQLTVMLTQRDMPAEELARRALEQGADLVVASGGDGTIAAVAGALRGTGVPLGIVPRGTANAFSVALGIPTHLEDPFGFAEKACDVITDGSVALVDMALVSTSTATDVPCILLAGVGFEAEMVEGADRELKDALGPAAYVVSGGAVLLAGGGNWRAKMVEGADRELKDALRPAAYVVSGGAVLLAGGGNWRAKVTVDGEEHEGEIGALTIANAAPPASLLAHGHVGDCIPDDGLLEVVGYVASDSVLDNFLGMTKLAVGVMLTDWLKRSGSTSDNGHLVRDEERMIGGRARDIRVEADPPQKVVVDGELMGTTPLTAVVQPASLRVCVPRTTPEGAARGVEVGVEDGGAAVRGAASAAASVAPGAMTGAGLAESAAAEPSYEAFDKQEEAKP
ncbi:MAG: ATP-NAD kinase-like domain-containing protein [Monoraphidium minutum]|nr:MAG: ATP-NAD kinase-like domain-containing protein [Monoraphidium minutum]